LKDRLVDCSALQKGFQAFYSTLLPKGGQPFLYLSLKLSPDKIDVNVHPTKSEVLFEDQDEIVQCVMEALGRTLAEQSTSRKLEGGRVQTFSFLTPDANGTLSPSINKITGG
jgi:DNA mismatch repair protein MLH1